MVKTRWGSEWFKERTYTHTLSLSLSLCLSLRKTFLDRSNCQKTKASFYGFFQFVSPNSSSSMDAHERLRESTCYVSPSCSLVSLAVWRPPQLICRGSLRTYVYILLPISVVRRDHLLPLDISRSFSRVEKPPLSTYLDDGWSCYILRSLERW